MDKGKELNTKGNTKDAPLFYGHQNIFKGPDEPHNFTMATKLFTVAAYQECVNYSFEV